MTDSQTDARKRAIDIIGEHFTAFILVTENEMKDDNEQEYNMARDGGYACCLGLLHHGIKIMHKNNDELNKEY